MGFSNLIISSVIVENCVSSVFIKDGTSWRRYFAILEISTVRHEKLKNVNETERSWSRIYLECQE